MRSPAAFAHALRAPGQLGLGRAYVSGELEVDDMDAVLDLLDSWQPPPLDRGTRARLALAAARPRGLRAPPRPPRAELRPRGKRHSRERDARSVRHHYDLPPEFFELFLGPSMTYSCAIFSRGATTLEEAQETKLELVCTKLALKPGQRVLDIGCGWGSFATHAAERHDVRSSGSRCRRPRPSSASAAPTSWAWATGSTSASPTTASSPTSPSTRWRASAWSSTSASTRSTYTRARSRGWSSPAGASSTTASPGCATATRRPGRSRSATCSPTRRPLHLSRIQLALERAGLETEHVEGFRNDYATTLEALGEQPRRRTSTPRCGWPAGAAAGLAALPERGPPGLRERLHLDLPGAGTAALGPPHKIASPQPPGGNP